MRYLIAYLAVGLIVGIWCACTLTPADLWPLGGKDLKLARIMAVPFHLVCWPLELLHFAGSALVRVLR